MEQLDEDRALARARALAEGPGPALLGIAGAPGAGKSTLADRVVAAVPGAVLVGMDGFHLAHATLEALGRVERKGAPDTFDAAGYVALLRRIRGLGPGADVVWAPRFHREIEDAVAGAVAVTTEATLVVTEGNYLLLADAAVGPGRRAARRVLVPRRGRRRTPDPAPGPPRALRPHARAGPRAHLGQRRAQRRRGRRLAGPGLGRRRRRPSGLTTGRRAGRAAPLD